MADLSNTPTRRRFLAVGWAGAAAAAFGVTAIAKPSFDAKTYVDGMDALGFGLIKAPESRSFFPVPYGGKGLTREKLAKLNKMNAAMLAAPDGIEQVFTLLTSEA